MGGSFSRVVLLALYFAVLSSLACSPGETRICVGAVLVRERGDDRREASPLVLLGRREAGRAFYPDVWDVLGGHLDPGETTEQALVRELREEAGVTPTAWNSLGEFREPLLDGSLVLRLYAVTDWTGVPRNCSPEEHAEVSWFAVEDQPARAVVG